MPYQYLGCETSQSAGGEESDDDNDSSPTASQSNNPDGRNGTKKCTSCRQRRKKCIGDAPNRCDHCVKRGFACGPRLLPGEDDSPREPPPRSALTAEDEMILEEFRRFRMSYSALQIISFWRAGEELYRATSMTFFPAVATVNPANIFPAPQGHSPYS